VTGTLSVPSLSESFTIEYSAIVDRPPLEWPKGARVAVWIAPNVELYQYRPPQNPHTKIYTRLGEPDPMVYSMLDYGNRVGFWRMVDVLDEYDVPASVSLNLAVLDHFPEIGEAIAERPWEIFSHGLYNSQFLYGMTRDEETAWVAENVAALHRHTGRRLKGMFGPALSQTPASMEIWAKAGLEYVVGLLMDDQPFVVNTRSGPLVSIPYAWDVNDALVMGGLPGRGGRYEARDFLEICKDQFDVLYAEGAETGRVMCVALHPFVIGQPWRTSYLDAALEYILSHDDIWLATAGQIAEFYTREVGVEPGTPTEASQ
jgi:peptidoglycan/xylan/chitin deacetylase (PgdA/CDA1 family)